MSRTEAALRLEQFFGSFATMLRYLSSTPSALAFEGHDRAWWNRYEVHQARLHAKRMAAALK